MGSSSAGFKPVLVIVVPGYAIAVFFASLATVFFALVPTVFPDQGRWGSIYRELENFVAMIYVGLLYTAMTAWPGYLGTLYTAHRLNRHGIRLYVIGGMVTALLAHAIFALLAKSSVFGPYVIFVFSVLGGAVGACAFWLWRRFALTIGGDKPGML